MYDVLRLRVLVAIVVMSCIVSCSRDPENGSAFTHEDILTVLRDQEGRINDFLLEYDNEETKKNESGVIVGRKRSSVMLMAKGNLFRTRVRILDLETQELTDDKEYGADGSLEYLCDRQALYGQIRSRLPEQAVMGQTLAEDYLGSVMRAPKKKFGILQLNLIGVLETLVKLNKMSEDFEDGISEELVDGRKIVVLTRTLSPTVGHSEIRLDPQMNFAVLSKTGIGMHEGNLKYVNSDFVEVIDGVWLPRKVERFKRDGKTSHTRHEIITVNTIEFNKGYEKDDFRIRFPPGVRVKNEDVEM
jgi:hypothetical protein